MKNRCIDVLKRVDVYKAMHSESNNKRLKTKQTRQICTSLTLTRENKEKGRNCAQCLMELGQNIQKT